MKELYKAENKTIIKDKLTFSSYKCEINGNTAKAEIVENYVYYFMGDSDYNLRYRKYIFNLEKDTDGWKIKHVCTDDPQETEENFAYEPINVKKGVDNAKEVVQLNDKIISNNKNSIQPSA